MPPEFEWAESMQYSLLFKPLWEPSNRTTPQLVQVETARFLKALRYAHRYAMFNVSQLPGPLQGNGVRLLKELFETAMAMLFESIAFLAEQAVTRSNLGDWIEVFQLCAPHVENSSFKRQPAAVDAIHVCLEAVGSEARNIFIPRGCIQCPLDNSAYQLPTIPEFHEPEFLYLLGNSTPLTRGVEALGSHRSKWFDWLESFPGTAREQLATTFYQRVLRRLWSIGRRSSKDLPPLPLAVQNLDEFQHLLDMLRLRFPRSESPLPTPSTPLSVEPAPRSDYKHDDGVGPLAVRLPDSDTLIYVSAVALSDLSNSAQVCNEQGHQPAKQTRQRPPAEGRDHLFLEWRNEGLTPAQIRDRWNAKTDEERRSICPKKWKKIKTDGTKNGRDVVYNAIKRARKNLEAQQNRG
ncbi:hypothetical protein [Thalassoroseus pseudoceratinae]|uniref:hypothetical protein n=1 Tax=Thalassoroseus pseudoceratinae TaxID=2713176 RepID=UPI00141F4CB8|nr:hypothetical protein [Thalassoroseus pseudoceratinae]